jgi:hypothetical protein
MTKEPGNAAATVPADGEFDRAYGAWLQGLSKYKDAKAAVEDAQRRQVEAIAALPEVERSDMARLEAIADELKIADLGDALCAELNTIDDLFHTMINLPAPTAVALFQKLEAIGEVPWTSPADEAGAALPRLTADAGTLSFEFPEVWLAQWRERGGSALLDPHHGDGLSIFRPEFSLSPDAVELERRQKKSGRPLEDHCRSWHGAFYDGQMRSLSDMLDLMPGAKRALKAMLEVNPEAGLPTAEAAAAAQREEA